MGLEPVTNTAPHADPTDPGRPGTPMDQHDRYLLPDPSGQREGLVPFTRASTVKARAQKGESLKDWNEKMLAKGLAVSPDLVALVASTPLGAPGSHAILGEAVEQAKIRAGARASANLGSALHAFTEQIDKGEAVADVLERVPEALKADVQAYVDLLAREGLTPVPELVERIVVNTKLQTGVTWDGKPGTRKDAAAGVAARFDRMYAWTDPTDGVTYLIPGDLKTGKNAVAYGSLETCVQEAIAARAQLLWNEETESYEDMPPTADAAGRLHPDHVGPGAPPVLRTDIGLMIHLPVGTGRCYAEELDLNLGWELAQLAVRLMIVDKAKDHCHRPFTGRRTEDVTVQITTVETSVVQDVPVPAAPSLREADVDEAPEDVTKAADGSPLQPLARDVGAKRGCSDCGRIKHRKGAPACWGDKDPAKAQEATVPVPDGVIACGPDGAVTELTPGDAATVKAFAEQLQARTDTEEPACPHAGGFTRAIIIEPGPDGKGTEPRDAWVCEHCGAETPRAADARRAREAMDSPGPSTPAEELPIPDENRSTDEDQPEPDGALEGPPKPQELASSDTPSPDEAELDALLAESPAESPEDAVFRFIAEAKTRQELQQVRRGALQSHVWTSEHTKAGLERLKQLTS